MKTLFLACALLLTPHQTRLWHLDFTSLSQPIQWQVINDGVMGGRSLSRVSYNDDGLLFEGTLSLENNGGFASTRAPINIRIPTNATITIRVKGDGRQYQLRFRPDGNRWGIAYAAQFESSDQWQTVTLTPGDFNVVYRGRRVIGAPPIEQVEMGTLGWMLADKQPGPFSLTIGSISLSE